LLDGLQQFDIESREAHSRALARLISCADTVCPSGAHCNHSSRRKAISPFSMTLSSSDIGINGFRLILGLQKNPRVLTYINLGSAA
jgi:hypothetical protein